LLANRCHEKFLNLVTVESNGLFMVMSDCEPLPFHRHSPFPSLAVSRFVEKVSVADNNSVAIATSSGGLFIAAAPNETPVRVCARECIHGNPPVENSLTKEKKKTSRPQVTWRQRAPLNVTDVAMGTHAVVVATGVCRQ
jgi:hypothetical protein